LDISPRGDAPGFVRILDDRTLAVPERPGNRRADTFTNLLENPTVGLIFLIPGKTETLRVSGTARIVRDSDLRDSMSVHGKAPDFALVVETEEAFFHCSKCVMRSNLWKPAEWPALEGLLSLAQTMVDAATSLGSGAWASNAGSVLVCEHRDRTGKVVPSSPVLGCGR
jgi:uncharacterized protein